MSAYKLKIEDVTRKMMAIISELTMQQVNCYVSRYVRMYKHTCILSLCMYSGTYLCTYVSNEYVYWTTFLGWIGQVAVLSRLNAHTVRIQVEPCGMCFVHMIGVTITGR